MNTPSNSPGSDVVEPAYTRRSKTADYPIANAGKYSRRLRTRLWILAGVVPVILAMAWEAYSYRASAPAAPVRPGAAKVVVSKALVRDVQSTVGFLGQFSAVEQVELRAQVGGTLTEIHFKDGTIVHKGDLLFVIDPRPYEIRLALATAQLETATARLELAGRELERAQALKRGDFGTAQNVDQRTAEKRAAQAAVDEARAQIRDAQFDLDHCGVTAPFTGRIGKHLVSVGNLIAGSRAATSPTTLLATLVSLDPIYLDFDMSESDFLRFARTRMPASGGLPDKVEIALSDEARFTRQGTLDFIDNILNRSSGTMRARATVSNPDLFLTPGAFARAQLIIGAPTNTLLVPDEAVLPDQSLHVVLTVASDGTVVPKKVEIGHMTGGLRVIRSGLSPEDNVIIGGVPFAAPGSKVAPSEGTIRPTSTQDQG